MKPPCHTSSQVKHKQSQQQLLKVIKLIKNFAALLLYANLHSLTHPPSYYQFIKAQQQQQQQQQGQQQQQQRRRHTNAT